MRLLQSPAGERLEVSEDLHHRGLFLVDLAVRSLEDLALHLVNQVEEEQ